MACDIKNFSLMNLCVKYKCHFIKKVVFIRESSYIMEWDTIQHFKLVSHKGHSDSKFCITAITHCIIIVPLLCAVNVQDSEFRVLLLHPLHAT